MIPFAILAGGLATRLRPLTEKIPKSLVEVAGAPFLDHQLRLLKKAGATRVVLCVGFLGGMIEEFAGDGSRFGLDIAYSQDGPDLKGTGGALQRALPLLGDRFFTLYGDSYLPIDYRAVERRFLEAGKEGLMTVYRNEGRWDSSNVEFDGSRILAYDKVNKSSRMHYIDYGLGAFDARAFRRVPTAGAADLATLYKDLLAADELVACEVLQRFYEIGSPAGIQELEEYLTT